jgi:hypothetical protein
MAGTPAKSFLENDSRTWISATKLTVMQESAASHEPSENKGQPDLGENPVPIAEFVGRPDFPECVRNRSVDIGGFRGVVIDIVNNSLKVRDEEDFTRSFNLHALRRLHGPRPEPPPAVPERAEEAPRPRPVFKPRAQAPQPVVKEAARNIIAEPDFSSPVRQIHEFTGRADFPECSLGQHVEINGYTGVVIEIVKRSLKVRSEQEITRSYNADILRKLHPPKQS